MKKITLSHARRLFVLVCALIIGIAALGSPAPSQAQTTYCSAPYLINVTLANGAKWTMCWEERANEGIVLRRITYTTPAGLSRHVLYQANLAQIFVPYDDNSARYHDLSDYGLGAGNLDNLAAADCPGGTLIANNAAKNVLCRKTGNAGYAYKYYGTQKQADALTLFSVSHIGQYNYVPVWRFFDDGSIEPGVGATGKLQKCTNNASYGWPLGNPSCTRGTSHIHNYYWRLDFDLDTYTNDATEQFDFNNSGGSTRPMAIAAINSEAARQVSPTTFRGWRIKDTVLKNTDNHEISYELSPSSSHVFRGPAGEPWTANDIYFSQYNICEKWASHNPTTGGCANNVAAFVNAQALSDVVVWYGMTFHHLPRDEDETYMSIHWSSFMITPRDWTATNPR